MPSDRKDNVFIEIDGERRAIWEWARVTGHPRQLIQGRLDRGWDPERAVFDEPRRYSKRANDIGSVRAVQH